MIYAVSFDGVIHNGEYPGIGEANERLIKHLILRKRLGDKLILWTCREGKLLDDAVLFCKSYGLLFDAVNDNLPEVIAKTGTNPRKIICDIHIDGRARSLDEYDYTGEVDINKIESALVSFADKVSMAV